MRVNNQLLPVTPGQGFIFQPGDFVVGSQDPKNPLTVFACHFSSNLRHDRTRLSPDILKFEVPNIAILEGKAKEAIHWAHQSPPANGIAKAIVAEIVLNALLRCTTQTPRLFSDKLSQLVLDIRANPGKKWNVAFMAKQAGFSIPHFNRVFRQTFGTSPNQFVTQQRIQHATQLLSETPMSIAQIADALGYNDHYYFHRQYKQITGTTPSQVRRKRALQARK